MASAT
ncbi:hypothetical protein D018_3021A, partial [Vibrio parahaemolyticus VP2007-007]